MARAERSVSSEQVRDRSGLLHRVWVGGVGGNERLTALTGLLLLLLLFVEGLTLLGIRLLLTVHAFVGLLLIPPILLKLASTGYRFVRYYTGSRAYRAAGPPALLLRMIAPFLVLSTIGLFGTGVILLAVGPAAREAWRPLHTEFFLIWFLLMTVHVLTYVWRLPRLALADLRPRHGKGTPGATPGSVTRQGLLVGSILLGLVVAIAAIPWDASWVHWLAQLGPES